MKSYEKLWKTICYFLFVIVYVYVSTKKKEEQKNTINSDTKTRKNRNILKTTINNYNLCYVIFIICYLLFEEKNIYGPSDVCEISAVDSTGTPAGSLGSLSVPSSWGGGRSPSGGARRGWVGTERSRGEGVLGTKFTQESGRPQSFLFLFEK